MNWTEIASWSPEEWTLALAPSASQIYLRAAFFEAWNPVSRETLTAFFLWANDGWTTSPIPIALDSVDCLSASVFAETATAMAVQGDTDIERCVTRVHLAAAERMLNGYVHGGPFLRAELWCKACLADVLVDALPDPLNALPWPRGGCGKHRERLEDTRRRIKLTTEEDMRGQHRKSPPMLDSLPKPVDGSMPSFGTFSVLRQPGIFSFLVVVGLVWELSDLATPPTDGSHVLGLNLPEENSVAGGRGSRRPGAGGVLNAKSARHARTKRGTPVGGGQVQTHVHSGGGARSKIGGTQSAPGRSAPRGDADDSGIAQNGDGIGSGRSDRWITEDPISTAEPPPPPVQRGAPEPAFVYSYLVSLHVAKVRNHGGPCHYGSKTLSLGDHGGLLINGNPVGSNDLNDLSELKDSPCQ